MTITGGVITAAHDLTIEAKSNVTSTLTTVPDDADDDDDEVDAAVASAILHSSANVTISGGDLDATNNAKVKAENTVNASTTADGLTGDKGATVGVTVFTGDTTATMSGGTLDAASIEISATSDRTGTTLAKATVGGANTDGDNTDNESERRLNDPNNDSNNSDRASTGDGDVGFAGAVAVAVVTGDTKAAIQGTGSVHASGSIGQLRRRHKPRAD